MQPTPRAHRPPHLYLSDTWYIVTASMVGHAALLVDVADLGGWSAAVRSLGPRVGVRIGAWVVLPNHYHLLLRTRAGATLPQFIGRLHGRTGREMNARAARPGRPVWYNYWDTCVRTDQAYWTRFNYIHQNPVKHGLVAQPDAWAFSSYNYYLRTRGAAWLADAWARYPVVDYLAGDDFQA
jgi:putative transposase